MVSPPRAPPSPARALPGPHIVRAMARSNKNLLRSFASLRAQERAYAAIAARYRNLLRSYAQFILSHAVHPFGRGTARLAQDTPSTPLSLCSGRTEMSGAVEGLRAQGHAYAAIASTYSSLLRSFAALRAQQQAYAAIAAGY